MWILLDVAILILFILFVVSSYKAGIVKSLLSLIGVIVSMVLSAYMSDIISQFIYDEFVRQSLLKQVNTFINEYISKNISMTGIKPLRGTPGFVLRTLMFCGLNEDSIQRTINDTTINATIELSNTIAPTIINVIRTSVAGVLFILFNMISRFFVRNIRTVCKLPVIHQVDSIFGAVLGAINFFIIIMLLMLIIRVFVPMMSNVPEIFSSSTINSTYIFKYLYYSNPLYRIFENIMIKEVY